MKNLFKKFLAVSAVCLIAFTAVAFAQDAGSIQPPSQSEITAFFGSLGAIGGLKGAALIAVIVQGVMLMFRSSIGDFAGKYKLLIVTGLTVVASVLAGVLSGQPVLAALLSAGALSSLQVFIHQLVTQIGEKPKA